MDSFFEYSDLTDVIEQSNYDPFYTPMGTATPAILGVIADFFEKNPSDSKIAYHQQLLKCQLDFSLSSLKRLDKFMIAFKNHQAKLNTQNAPLDDDLEVSNLFMLLSGYIGEVFARARGQVGIWFHSSEIKNPDLLGEIAKQNFHKHFVNSGLVYFENLASGEPDSAFMVLFGYDKKLPNKQNVGVFLASFPVYKVLAGGQYISFYDYVVDFLNKIGETIPADTQILSANNLLVEVNLSAQLANLKPIERYYLQIKKPTWMDENNLLYQQLTNLANLYKSGKVVWGAIIQANKEMYSNDGLYEGQKSQKIEGYPAEIIYDPTGRTHITELIGLAHKLYELKHTKPTDSTLAKLADRITSETEYSQGMDYPKAFTSLALKISTVFVWRLHLPNGLISTNFFPILIDEHHQGVVTVLPSRFWREDFVKLWLDSQYDITRITWRLDRCIHNRESQNVPAWLTTDVCTLSMLTNPALMPNLTDLFANHEHISSDIAFVEEQPIVITLPQQDDGFIAIKQDGSVKAGIVNKKESHTKFDKNASFEYDEEEDNSNGFMALIGQYPILLVVIAMAIIWVFDKLMR